MKLPTQRAPRTPDEPGWYLCWERYNDQPMVLCWGTASRFWRRGVSRVEVIRWAGPLPGRQTAHDQL